MKKKCRIQSLCRRTPPLPPPQKTSTQEHKQWHTPANVKARRELQFPIGEGSLLELRDEALEVGSERKIKVEDLGLFFLITISSTYSRTYTQQALHTLPFWPSRCHPNVGCRDTTSAPENRADRCWWSGTQTGRWGWADPWGSTAGDPLQGAENNGRMLGKI